MSVERRLSAVEVQAHFDEVLQYVSEQQQPVLVECDGEARAAIISIEAYESLKAWKLEDAGEM